MRLWILTLCLAMVALGWADETFEAGVQQWRQAREAGLRKSDGWLTLAGLFWLHDGDNTFGSAAGSDFRFPDKAPAHMGKFVLHDGKVDVILLPGIDVRVGGQPVQKLVLDPHDEEAKTSMSIGTLTWYLIDRDGRLAIRVKDSASPVLASFHGLQYYPTDSKYCVVGQIEAPAEPRTVIAPTAMGIDTKVDVRGTIRFSIDGHPLSLEAFGEPGETDLSVYFGDPTNGHGSYPSGRYLEVPAPNADGQVTVDFNRAYNPPCAFTAYATCVFPPKENRLSVPIEAGEKFSGH